MRFWLINFDIAYIKNGFLLLKLEKYLKKGHFMEYLEHLKALKDKTSLTYADISQISDVPLTTVTRIFSGATPNPTFDTVTRITLALGGSLDNIADIKPDNGTTSTVEKTISTYAELLKEKDERIKEKDKHIESLKTERLAERKEKHKLALFTAVFVGFVLFVLIFDMLNGHFGYFRY